jgi:hypothetical protein
MAKASQTYYDTVRSMTRDPKVLKAVDKAEADERAGRR